MPAAGKEPNPAENGDACEFAEHNPMLAKLVPENMHENVDKLLPNAAESVLDKAVSKTHRKYHEARSSLEDSVGEVAGVLFRVAKYAAEKFHIGDVVFGVYHLALHHATVNDADLVEGKQVTDAALVDFLIEATNAADAAYLPTREQLCAAAGISDEQLLIFQPETNTTRPAYAVWVDEPNKRLVWGFRGTTDLNDMLTDACASCTPYCGGYAHWGMLEAAEWFVENELPAVQQLLKDRPGYELLLVGHSLGAGTAAMLAHLLKNNAAAAAAVEGVKFQAVGIATPAVLTAQLSDDCSDYITSVVLMHDMVPRFSIHNVFSMKEEMDATDWREVLKLTIQDWLVPDVVESTETFQKLAKGTSNRFHHLKKAAGKSAGHLASLGANLKQRASGLLSKEEDTSSSTSDTNGAAGAPQQNGSHAAGHGVTVAEAAQASKTNLGVVEQAVDDVADKLQSVNKEDVHEVFAPGRLIHIKRLDKHKGRAKYGNTVHRCVLCKDDAVVPVPEEDSEDEEGVVAAAAGAKEDKSKTGEEQEEEKEDEMYPGAKFELIEGAPGQRFSKIVLQATCLSDHLTGGYKQGLRFAQKKLREEK